METIRNSDLLDNYYNSGRRWSEEVCIHTPIIFDNLVHLTNLLLLIDIYLEVQL